MLAQTDLLDEIEVGIEDLLRRVAADHADEQRDDALGDERVAIGGEDEAAIGVVALQPHAALTTLDEVLLVLVLLVQRLEVVAQVDQHLILVHPVGKLVELLDDLVLQFVDRIH